MNGVFLLDKPPGPTSHDAVQRIRRAAGTRRVGHAGTLDPPASGLLVVLLGEATKLSPFLSDASKCYEATVALGVATDTLDAAGRETGRAPVAPLDREGIEGAIARLLGRRLQRPPAYSAVKVRGVPLYRHARAGRSPESPERPIEVFEARLLGWAGTSIDLELRVSPGTYIRSLAVDLAALFGTVGHCSRLRRLGSGPFGIEGAVPLDAVTPEILRERLIPLEEALPDLPRVEVDPEGARRLRAGQKLPPPAGVPEGLVRAVSGGGLVAVARVTPRALAPERTFPP